MTSTDHMLDARYVWIDTETTGLAPERDLLLEVAVVITDHDLNEIDSMSEVVWQPIEQVIDLMDATVHEMHARSGLLRDLGVHHREASSVHAVEQRITDFIIKNGAAGAVVAGSTISFDRAVLDRYMPGLNRELLHYRSIDVSSIKELAKVWAPNVLKTAPEKSHTHRAYPDIQESIAELRHYIAAGLVSEFTYVDQVARAATAKLKALGATDAQISARLNQATRLESVQATDGFMNLVLKIAATRTLPYSDIEAMVDILHGEDIS